jgi:hypothetical protein
LFPVSERSLLQQRGVAIFAKACFGHPSPSKRQKLNATNYGRKRVNVDHATLNRWVIRYSPAIAENPENEALAK